MNKRSVKAHEETDGHKRYVSSFKYWDIKEQIQDQFNDDCEEGKYDPNYPFLDEEEEEEYYNKMQSDLNEKFQRAWKDGYFDKYEPGEEIDFIEYNFYHKMNIKLNPQKEVSSDDDSDSDDDE